jgi:hypothetical protein
MTSAAPDLARGIRPHPEQLLLLRACLGAPDDAREAWDNWRQRVGVPQRALSDPSTGIRRLFPLLFHAVSRHGFPVEKETSTLLRTAYLRDEARHATYARIAADALTALQAAGLRVIALKGAALAYTAYERPMLRHCHDLDVLVPDESLHEASKALHRMVLHSPRLIGEGHLRLLHESGLPIVLHSRLFRFPYYDMSFAELWSRSEAATVAGVDTRMLSPLDTLVHVCGHASYSTSRRSLVWISDACHLLARHPALDWSDLPERAGASRLSLPLHVTLEFLARDMGAPIPGPSLDSVHAAAQRAPVEGRALALFGAARNPGEHVAAMARMPGGWPSRRLVASSLCFPPPRAVRSAYAIRIPAALPFWYVFHVARQLISMVSAVCRRKS